MKMASRLIDLISKKTNLHVQHAYGHVITKISRMGRLLNFLTQGASTTSNYQ